jgi:geranylgeranyl pyrophosphate synthase
VLEAVTRKAVPRSPLAVPDQLKDLAETLMEEAQSGPSDYDTAMTLLAADALITYACEIVADGEPEKLGELR